MSIEVLLNSNVSCSNFDPVNEAQEIYTWFKEMEKTEKVTSVEFRFILNKNLKESIITRITGFFTTYKYYNQENKGELIVVLFPDKKPYSEVQEAILKQLQKIKSDINQSKKSARSFTFTLTERAYKMGGLPYMYRTRQWNISTK